MDKLEITYGMTSCNRNARTIGDALAARAASRSDKRTRRIPLETGLTKIDGTSKYRKECECQWLPIFPFRFIILLKGYFKTDNSFTAKRNIERSSTWGGTRGILGRERERRSCKNEDFINELLQERRERAKAPNAFKIHLTTPWRPIAISAVIQRKQPRGRGNSFGTTIAIGLAINNSPGGLCASAIAYRRRARNKLITFSPWL